MKGKGIRNGLAALVLMLAVLLCAWAAAEEIPENAQDLVLDQEMRASVGENESAYFRFVPEETAVYDFCSLYDSDAHGTLYREEGGTLQYMAGNEYGDGEEMDFRVSHILMGGETYYFAARLVEPEESGSFRVRLTRNLGTGLRANAVSSPNVIVKPEESATLRVIALGGVGELTYRWTVNGEEMTDQTTDVCTIESVTYITGVDCSVSDQDGNEVWVSFNIDIDNGFSAEADGPDTVGAEPDTPVTLTVKAKCDKGGVSYQWLDPAYDEVAEADYLPIEGATEPSYTVPVVNEPVDYYCVVKDDYGNQKTVIFRLYVDNGFSAELGGPKTVWTLPRETVTMKVNAACKKGAITYQWQEYVYDDEEEDEIPKDIEGATEASYTVNEVIESRRFCCYVRDEYGNAKNLECFLAMDNGLFARAEGSNRQTVAPGETVTLKVEAGCKVGELTYQWYEPVWNEDIEDEEERFIEGAAGPSYTTPGINTAQTIMCLVRDEFGGVKHIGFNIEVDSGFYAEAEGSDRVTVPIGETAVLKVNAGCNVGGLSYIWYDSNTDEIEGATEPSYTTEEISSATMYSCQISDDYGHTEWIDFYVGIENGFTAAADGPVSLKVRTDETKTVNWRVKASADEGEITYQWYRDDEEIEGATEASYTEELQGGTFFTRVLEYYCEVRDCYGNDETVWFEVQFDNGFIANADSPIEIKVKPGKTVTMKVFGQARTGDVYYQWYEIAQGPGHANMPIPDAHGASYTSEKIYAYSQYQCYVTDEYGNAKPIYFYISIDNGLSMTAESPTEIMVNPGDAATMKVSAEADEGEITYQWYRRDYIDESVYFSDQPITDAASASLTVEDVQSYKEYSCHATDVFGNYEVVDFKVGVDNDFYAKADGPLYVTVEPGEPLSLKVIAKANAGDITYQWYVQHMTEQGFYDMNEIEGATEAAYTAAEVDRHGLYFCDVRDSYGTMTRVTYWVYVDNGLTAEADGPDHVTAGAGDSVTLKVRASAKEGDLTYEWYEQKYEEKGDNYSYKTSYISGETGTSLTTEATGFRREIICRVKDRYDNYAEVLFVIDAENTLTAGPEGSSVITVSPGETATLKVRAETGAGEILYNWYKMNYIRGAYTLTKVSGAENSNTYTTEALYQNTQYQCHVRDQFGNEKNIYFMVKTGDTPELQLNVPTQAEITAGGSYALFSFVPQESGNYRIQSTGSDDTFVTLFDGSGSGEWIAKEKDDDGGTNQNFGLNADLEAGHTYYYAVSFYPAKKTGTISFKIRIYHEDNGFTVSADGPSELVVMSGETAVLKVTAEADDPEGITYEWRKRQEGEAEGDYTVIEGADGPSYETEELLVPTGYSCLVTDAYGHQKEVTFTVDIHRHTLKAHAKADSTCTETGTEAYWECEECGLLFSDEEGETEIEAPIMIEKKAHTLTAHAKVDSTCTEAGTEAYWICDVCEKLFSDEKAKTEIEEPIVIAKKPHTLTAHAKVDPTCTEAGTEAYWTCDVCEKLFSDKEAGNEIEEPVVIPAKEHDWNAAEYEWSEDNTSVTATRTCKNDPSHKEEETAETKVEITSPTDHTAGAVTYTTDEFGNEYFTVQTKSLEIPALADMSVIRLPDALKVIEMKAFENLACEAVIIPDGCTSIEDYAFSSCRNLKYVRVPANADISPKAFDGCQNVVVDRIAE